MRCVLCNQPIEPDQGWADTTDRAGKVHVRCADADARTAFLGRRRDALRQLSWMCAISGLYAPTIFLAPAMLLVLVITWIVYLLMHRRYWQTVYMSWRRRPPARKGERR
jgi:hypothetical protein